MAQLITTAFLILQLKALFEMLATVSRSARGMNLIGYGGLLIVAICDLLVIVF